MKLKSYPEISERWRKVLKHVFAPTERWWDVFGSLESWQQDWTKLRATGCFHLEEGYRAIDGKPEAEAVANRNHDAWLAAAERAVDEAFVSKNWRMEARGDRMCFVGDRGVQVIATRSQHLVTCFRPGGGSSRLSDADRVATVLSRSAIRRDKRRSSLKR